MVSDVLERAKEEGEERWDDDFAEGISFSKLGTSPSSSAFFPLNLFFLVVIFFVLSSPCCNEDRI